MIPNNSKATLKQIAYARRAFGAQGETKKQIALDVGYAPGISPSQIESTQGYKDAIAILAEESHNLVLAAMAEFQSRGLQDFSNKELTTALTAITTAWEKIGKGQKEYNNRGDEYRGPNQLRAIILQNINNTVDVTPEEEEEEMGF